jgi:hypothetical protein
MFGIPTETELEWQQDLERALRLQPDHLSCYNLTFEPGTRLTHEQREGRVAANDEEIDRAMFLWTRERLAASGFEAYEISNFAGAVTNTIALVSVAPQFRLNYSLVLTNGAQQVRLTGPLTNQVIIDATSNLRDWSEIQVYDHVMPLDFTDLDPRHFPERYYRATLTPPGDPLYEWTTIDDLRAFRIRGLLVRDLLIERSTNLTSWSPLLTNKVFIYVDFKDSDSTNLPMRFYRLHAVP